MSNAEMLKIIGQKFPVIVRNEYHIQIRHDDKKYTDIWPMGGGGLKVRLYGQHSWYMVHTRGFDNLIAKLSTFDYKSDNDLARMRELERLMTKVKGKDGIYCDAGWKDGRAKIAVIRIFGTDLDITVREGEYSTSIEAEMIAIKLARTMYPHAETIYSDCLPAVTEYNDIHRCDIIKWIDRSNNKEADKLSNLRK